MYNEESKEFDFHPTWYIESVKFQQQFEENLVKTQLFIGYIDEETQTNKIENDDHKLQSAITISNWLGRRWRNKQPKAIVNGA